MSLGILGSTDLESFESLHAVLENHEFSVAMKLGMKMSKAGKKGYYDTWVLKEQHLVQELGRAYADRLISTAARDAIKHADKDIKVIILLAIIVIVIVRIGPCLDDRIAIVWIA